MKPNSAQRRKSVPDNEVEADAILVVSNCDDRITPAMRQDVAWGLYLSHRRAYILTSDDADHESALWWLGRFLLAGGEIERKE